MKEPRPRHRRRAFVLSQDKSQISEAPLSKRAGKQPIYYNIGTFEDVQVSTPFQQSIQQRAHYGEVVSPNSSTAFQCH